MRIIPKLFVIASLVFLTGCGSLWPGKVEFFQKKIQPFPEHSPKQQEVQRQTAALAAKRATDTFNAAVSNQVPVAVVFPASDTAILTRAVSTSLGPPSKPYVGASTNLAAKLDAQTAIFNSRVDDFAERESAMVGKKVEGTGLFKMGYFTYVGLILLLLFLAWGALKLYGLVNPVVGLGVNTFGRVSSSVLKNGYTQVVKAGEEFKGIVKQSGIDAAVQEKVLDWFTRAHEKNQSPEHQDIIKELTK